jgi:plasmid stabilization system protein ParE
MRVRYSETALRELDEIFAYLYERNRSAAAAVVERIERLGTLIGELPFIGRAMLDPRRGLMGPEEDGRRRRQFRARGKIARLDRKPGLRAPLRPPGIGGEL